MHRRVLSCAVSAMALIAMANSARAVAIVTYGLGGNPQTPVPGAPSSGFGTWGLTADNNTLSDSRQANGLDTSTGAYNANSLGVSVWDSPQKSGFLLSFGGGMASTGGSANAGLGFTCERGSQTVAAWTFTVSNSTYTSYGAGTGNVSTEWETWNIMSGKFAGGALFMQQGGPGAYYYSSGELCPTTSLSLGAEPDWQLIGVVISYQFGVQGTNMVSCNGGSIRFEITWSDPSSSPSSAGGLGATPVPEPLAPAILGLGCAGLALRRRHRA